MYADQPITCVSVTGRLSFDGAVKQWVQLAQGRTVVLVPDAAREDPAEWVATLTAAQADAWDGTPGQIASALASGWTPPIQTLLIGGEAIPPALWTALVATGIPAWNLYGPTECTVDATAGRITGDTPTIGTPLPGVQVWVVTSDGELAPIGTDGELWIGGAGVARGYVDEPAATAAAFVPDPWSGVPGSRVYRTGDWGHWRADGTLVVRGRRDTQVKVRGHRVELGEVEAGAARSIRRCGRRW